VNAHRRPEAGQARPGARECEYRALRSVTHRPKIGSLTVVGAIGAQQREDAWELGGLVAASVAGLV
jgi:hypothetical protein